MVVLTWRLNSQRRHAGLDPASSGLLDSRLRGNDEFQVFIRRSNIASIPASLGIMIFRMLRPLPHFAQIDQVAF